jgi:hypothetical protein
VTNSSKSNRAVPFPGRIVPAPGLGVQPGKLRHRASFATGQALGG